MKALDYIRLGYDIVLWAQIEGVDYLLTGPDMPYSEAATGETHVACLAFRELRTSLGISGPWDGVTRCGTVRLPINDTSGLFAGLTGAPTLESYLTAELAPGDTSCRIADASSWPASGTVYIGTETRTYSGKSSNTLTGLSAPIASLNPEASYRALADGTVPRYRVANAPTYLEGRYLRLLAAAVDSGGGAVHDYADASELWRGPITGVPLSLDGIRWELEVAGPDRWLQGSIRPGSVEAQFPAEDVTITGEGIGYIYVTESTCKAALRIIAAWPDGEVQKDLSFFLPTGWLTWDSWQTYCQQVAAVVTGCGIAARAQESWIAERIWLISDEALIITPLFEPGCVWLQLGINPGANLGIPLLPPGTFFLGGGQITDVSTAERAVFCAPAGGREIPIVSAKPLDWRQPGCCELSGEGLKTEVVLYQSYRDGGSVQMGQSQGFLYVLEECTRGELGSGAREYRSSVLPVPQARAAVAVSGATIGEAINTLLTDDELGQGIGTAHIAADLAGTPSSGYPAVAARLTGDLSLTGAISDLCLLEGKLFGPQYQGDGTFRLGLTTFGAPRPDSDVYVLDYDQSLKVESGLGRVVTGLEITLVDDYRVAVHYLPVEASLRIVQTKSLAGYAAATRASLDLLAAAGYDRLRLFGRPQLLVGCSLPKEYRGLLPGEQFRATLPDGGERSWVVLSVDSAWIGGSDPCRVVLLQTQAVEARYLAPAATVDTVPDATHVVLLPVSWTAGVNPFDSLAALLDIDLFEVGDQVRFLQTAGTVVDRTITAVDRNTYTLTLSGAGGTILGGDTMVHLSYSTCVSADRWHWLAASGTTYGEWA